MRASKGTDHARAWKFPPTPSSSAITVTPCPHLARSLTSPTDERETETNAEDAEDAEDAEILLGAV
jgi:hypothetical protein